MSLDEFSELQNYELDRRSIRKLPKTFCERHDVVVLGEIPTDPGEPIIVGSANPVDSNLLLQIADILQRQVEAVRLNHWEVDKALDVGFGDREAHASDHRVLPTGVNEHSMPPDILDHLLFQAVEQQASDIHIETYREDVDVRFRIDGILHQVFTVMHPENVGEVISRIKVLADLDITEKRRPQDGRIRCLVGSDPDPKMIDLRISIVPSPVGEDAVIRILDSEVGLIPVHDLGMPSSVENVFLQLLANPEGMILVTGPTGSGKTTTLYAALSQINDGRRKVITAEDPIEYYVPKVNQKQISEQMPLHSLLRAMLRQDPDVMLVGEIRDKKTGSTAMTAAMTGHLVLGTLHTADAIGTVVRLRGLDLDDSDIGDALLAVVGQRLVRRICPDCSAPAEPTPEQRELFGLLLEELQPRHGLGCDECHHTGYRGRIGVFELLLVDQHLRNMIADGKHGLDLREYARANDFVTMVEDAVSKVAEGLTTLDELARVLSFRQISAIRNELRVTKEIERSVEEQVVDEESGSVEPDDVDDAPSEASPE